MITNKRSFFIRIFLLALIIFPSFARALPTTLSDAEISTLASNLQINNITSELEGIVDIVSSTLADWLTIDLTSTALSKEHFSMINNAYLLVACVDGVCDKSSSRGTSTNVSFNPIVEQTGSFGGLAKLEAELKDTLFTNPFCIGPVSNKASLECEHELVAPSRDGDIFVRDSSAAYYGLIYDGEGSGNLQVVDREKLGKIYKATEPSSLALILLGIIGIVANRKWLNSNVG